MIDKRRIDDRFYSKQYALGFRLRVIRKQFSKISKIRERNSVNAWTCEPVNELILVKRFSSRRRRDLYSVIKTQSWKHGALCDFVVKKEKNQEPRWDILVESWEFMVESWRHWFKTQLFNYSQLIAQSILRTACSTPHLKHIAYSLQHTAFPKISNIPNIRESQKSRAKIIDNRF